MSVAFLVAEGNKMRSRKCDNPAPQRGGKGCGGLGPARELRICQAVCPPGMPISSGLLDLNSV